MPTVTVDSDDLEVLLFATGGIKDLEAGIRNLENLLGGRKHNPMVSAAVSKLEAVHDRLSTAYRRAKREVDMPKVPGHRGRPSRSARDVHRPLRQMSGVRRAGALPDSPRPAITGGRGPTPLWEGYKIEWPAPARFEFRVTQSRQNPLRCAAHPLRPSVARRDRGRPYVTGQCHRQRPARAKLPAPRFQRQFLRKTNPLRIVPRKRRVAVIRNLTMRPTRGRRRTRQRLGRCSFRARCRAGCVMSPPLDDYSGVVRTRDHSGYQQQARHRQPRPGAAGPTLSWSRMRATPSSRSMTTATSSCIPHPHGKGRAGLLQGLQRESGRAAGAIFALDDIGYDIYEGIESGNIASRQEWVANYAAGLDLMGLKIDTQTNGKGQRRNTSRVRDDDDARNHRQGTVPGPARDATGGRTGKNR